MRIFAILSLFVCLLAALPLNAFAQTGEWAEYQDIKARLIAGSNNEAILEIALADGWHTYWRNPGDSGLPPMFSWAESKNIKDVEVFWPAPIRKKEYEFNTFGFDNELILPLTFSREKMDKKAKLDLKAQIMICKDICIPQKLDVSLDLADGDLAQADAAIAKAKESLPQENPIEGLTIDSIVAAKDVLIVSITSTNGFEGIDVFPVIEEDYLALANPPEVTISEHDETKAMIKIAAPSDIENLAAQMQEKTLSVTLVQGDRAVFSSVEY